MRHISIRNSAAAAALIAALTIGLAACGTDAAPQAAPVTVTATATATLPAKTVATTVEQTVERTKVSTKSVTEEVTVTETTTKSAPAKVSNAVACQLLVNGPGGQDGAVSRLADLLTGMAGKSITQAEADKIASKAKSINEELTGLRDKAPDDWTPSLTILIDESQAVYDGMTSGKGLNINNTDDVRGAGYDLVDKCGAS